MTTGNQESALKPPLPIDEVLPDLLNALRNTRHAVLQAPPGAGKTTRVPLAILQSGLLKGRILVLEPRRLATRAAAERMARSLREKVGETVGYRIRGETRTSPSTRIEVVTEGILTRMIQSQPDLPGIDAIVFDEFHERSLQADLGLALALEIRAALREDLMLVVMSATLHGGPVSTLLGNAPLITSEGRSFAVETRWLDRPWKDLPGRKTLPYHTAMADLVEKAVNETTGGLLVFLPGEREIRSLESLLSRRLTDAEKIFPLYGMLDYKTQTRALAPLGTGRKIVLATSIAETSLTIEDIRVVVDGGRARRAAFDPGNGMSRLVTTRVTRAEADQRRGRAGRVAPGVCYRFWTRGEEGGLAPFPPAEIQTADLAPLILETALWGVRDPSDLPFFEAPNPGRATNAKALLRSLGALDAAGAITGHGRQMAKMPLHPRLGHMVLKGGPDAGEIAALLGERDILKHPAPSDLTLRIDALRNPSAFEKNHPYDIHHAALARVRAEAGRLKRKATRVTGKPHTPGALLALAYPDRVGMRRTGDSARYLLSGGNGAVIREGDPMGLAPFVVACDLDGARNDARVRLAVRTDEETVRSVLRDRIENRDSCVWSPKDGKVLALRQETLGALVLKETTWKNCPAHKIAVAMLAGIRTAGLDALPLPRSERALIARVEWLRAGGMSMPDFSPEGLTRDLENWLMPFLGNCRDLAGLKTLDYRAALSSALDADALNALRRLAPEAIKAPTGTRLLIDYDSGEPKISVRLQELFGLKTHPRVGPARTPLLIELLSPARRPVQTTKDLPGFWRSSYLDVRKDMRGRYPKHPWPEDPANATPTRRAKPRKGR